MGKKRAKYQHRNDKPSADAVDPNADIIVRPTDKAPAVEEAPKPKMTKKKKKRLESYIAKKLKKEERVVLLDKLSKSTFSSDLMKSSKVLGNAKETQRERLRRALNEQRAGFEASDPSVRLVIERPMDEEATFPGFAPEDSSDDNDDDDEDEVDPHKVEIVMGDHRLSKPAAPSVFNPFETQQEKEDRAIKEAAAVLSIGTTVLPKSAVTVGSALKSGTVPSTGSSTNLLPPTRKRKKVARRVKVTTYNGRKVATMANGQDSSEDSFDSSDSEYDTDREALLDKVEEKLKLAEEELARKKRKSLPDDDGSNMEDGSESDSDASESDGITEGFALSVPITKGLLDDSIFVSPDIEVKPKAKSNKPKSDAGKVAGPRAKAADDKSKAYYVRVDRKPEIQKARLQLPVCAEEQNIMETINSNLVTILCGETGSGKTTQVPQFLFEAGYGSPGSDNPGMIGCTQPRRVAAVSMAKRVGQELNVSEKVVSYQIRYDATVSASTAIKFMTDGVLLRELTNDLLLTKYSALLIDEAHERSLNTDILIGVVSRVVRLRQKLYEEYKNSSGSCNASEPIPRPLRIIIMSATLRVKDFTENTRLFETPPPVLKVEARQYPVQSHFSRKTVLEQGGYLEEALKKVCRIHKRLPEGGILVFLTGQAEIAVLCKKLRRRFPMEEGSQPATGKSTTINPVDNDDDLDDNEGVDVRNAAVEPEEVPFGESDSSKLLTSVIETPEAKIEEDTDITAGEEDKDRTDDGDEDLIELFDDLDGSDSDEEGTSGRKFGAKGDGEDEEEEEEIQPLHVLPLYSLLSTAHQMRVFEPPPKGTRLCVVATNVAETSLTIPGIKYVVDCGRVKERSYDVETGVQSYDVVWTSKAAADQRAGRAGRTGPGHCYRLYSSAVFDQRFRSFSDPEILRMPVDGVILQMKGMNIDNVRKFPFPTPPEREALFKAERLLSYLNALEKDGIADGSGRITELGRTMSAFPLAPRFAKMLIIGQQHECLPYIIAIVSALTVGDPFVRDHVIEHGDDDDEEGEEGVDDEEKARREARRKMFYGSQAKHAGADPTSDLLKLLNVVGAYEYTTESARETFCEENFVRPKAMLEIRKLRGQITNIVQSLCPGVDVCVDPKMSPPSELQSKVIRQILASGYIDQIALRKDLTTNPPTPLPSHETARGIPYCTMWSPEVAYVHPSSILHDSTQTGKTASAPAAIAYQELVRSHGSGRVWLKGVTVVHPRWLSKLGKGLCVYSRPVANVAGSKSAALAAAKRKKAGEEGVEEERVPVIVIPQFGPKGWPLPAEKAEQRKVGGRWILDTSK